MWRFSTPPFDHKVIAVALTLWLVYILESFAFSLMLFIIPSSFLPPIGRGVEPNFIVIIPLRILSRILIESIAPRIEFGHVKLQSFVSVVLFRCFIHSCQFLVAGYISDSSGMFFVASSCDIVTNLLPDASTSNLKLVFFSCLWPSLPLRKKNKITWNHTLRRRASGLLIAMAGEALNFIKSSLSIAGLWVTFSLPWRFKRTIWAFHLTVDIEDLNSVWALCSGVVHSGISQKSARNQGERISCRIPRTCSSLQHRTCAGLCPVVLPSCFPLKFVFVSRYTKLK